LKNKLKRFEALKSFSNYFQPQLSEEFFLRGRWNTDYFKNDNPIVLELGCGKGEYTVGLAQRFPDKNFIGMDIKGSRMYVGALQSLEKELKNVAFCRTKIDFITNYFIKNEVSEIWLTFSDPQPKKPNKRLTSPRFIQRYKEILKPKGLVHLKTDSDLLFDYTIEEIRTNKYPCSLSTQNLYTDSNIEKIAELKELLLIQTHYEQLFMKLGKTIKYCQFQLY